MAASSTLTELGPGAERWQGGSSVLRQFETRSSGCYPWVSEGRDSQLGCDRGGGSVPPPPAVAAAMPQPQAAYDAVLAGILATQSTALSSGCCLRANHRVPVQFIHDIVRRLLLLDLLTADDQLRQQQSQFIFVF